MDAPPPWTAQARATATCPSPSSRFLKAAPVTSLCWGSAGDQSVLGAAIRIPSAHRPTAAAHRPDTPMWRRPTSRGDEEKIGEQGGTDGSSEVDLWRWEEVIRGGQLWIRLRRTRSRRRFGKNSRRRRTARNGQRLRDLRGVRKLLVPLKSGPFALDPMAHVRASIYARCKAPAS